MTGTTPHGMFRLDGRVALVIGGSGAIGSAIARGLGEAGAHVVVTSRSSDRAQACEEALADAGVRGRGLVLDPADRRALEAGLALVETDHGPVRVLVNAVGGNDPAATVTGDGTFGDLPPGAIEQVVGLNLFQGAIIPCQVVGERMVASGGAGSIVNITSMAAFRPLTRVVGYGAAKAAVSNFTRWLAVHYARDRHSRVRVNAIAPGFVLTGQNRFLLTGADGELTARGAQVISQTPMGRFGTPEEIAGAAVWLAGDASTFVTGIVVPVDGGFSAFSGV